MRIVADVILYIARKMPVFNPRSITSYHMHEAGAIAAQGPVYTLADRIEYVYAVEAICRDVAQLVCKQIDAVTAFRTATVVRRLPRSR